MEQIFRRNITPSQIAGSGPTGRAVLAAETHAAARGAIGVYVSDRSAAQAFPAANRTPLAAQNIVISGDSVAGDSARPGSFSSEGVSPTHPFISDFRAFYMWDDERKIVDGSNHAGLLAAPYNIASGTRYSQGILNWAPSMRSILGGRRRMFCGAEAGAASWYLRQVWDACTALPGFLDAIHVFAWGQNGFRTGFAEHEDASYGLSLVQGAISQLTHDRYLVCTVTNLRAGGAFRATYDALLRANIPAKNLLDIRALMQANPDGSSQDAARLAADDPPASFMRDAVHLSDMGSIFYGHMVAQRIIENGW